MAQDDQNKNKEMECPNDFVTFVDEEGIDHTYKILDAIKIIENGDRYMAMAPYYKQDSELLENDAELIIMKVFVDDKGEYVNIIEDAEEFNMITSIFNNRLKHK